MGLINPCEPREIDCNFREKGELWNNKICIEDIGHLFPNLEDLKKKKKKKKENSDVEIENIEKNIEVKNKSTNGVQSNKIQIEAPKKETPKIEIEENITRSSLFEDSFDKSFNLNKPKKKIIISEVKKLYELKRDETEPQENNIFKKNPNLPQIETLNSDRKDELKDDKLIIEKPNSKNPKKSKKFLPQPPRDTSSLFKHSVLSTKDDLLTKVKFSQSEKRINEANEILENDPKKSLKIFLEIEKSLVSPSKRILSLLCYSLGKNFFICEEYSKSMENFQRVIDLGCENVCSAFCGIGKVYYKKKEYEKSEESFLNAIKIDKNNLQAHYNLGCLFLIKEKYVEAIEKFKYCEIREYQKIYCINSIGCCYFRLKENKKSLECFSECLKINPDFVLSLVGKSAVFFSEKKYDNSLKCLLHAEKIDPTDEILFKIGLNYKSKEQYEKAMQYYEKIKEKNELVHYEIGNDYSRKEKFLEAISSYSQSLKLNEANEKCLFNLGVVYYKVKEHLKSLEQFAKVVSVNPNNFEAYFYIGKCYKINLKYSKAIEMFSKTIELNKNFYDALLERCICYYYEKQYENCEKDLLVLYKKNEQNEKVNFYFGVLYLEMNKFHESITYFTNSIKLKGSNRSPNDFLQRGNAHKAVGLFEEAIDDYKVAVGLFGKENKEKLIDIFNTIGVIHANGLFQNEKALKYFKKVLQIDNNNHIAQSNILEIEKKM